MKFVRLTNTFLKKFSIKFAPVKETAKNELQNPFVQQKFFNKKVLRSQNAKEAIELIAKYSEIMNLINISTSLKVFLNFNKDFSKSPHKEQISHLLIKKSLNIMNNKLISEEDARSIANIYFYMNKLQETMNYFYKNALFAHEYDIFLEKIEENIVKLIDKMNSQEVALTIFTLSKLKRKEILENISEKITKRVFEFIFRSNAIIFYSYTSLDLEIPALYKQLDIFFCEKADSQNLTNENLVHVIFGYSKITNIIQESRIFEYINKIFIHVIASLDVFAITSIVHSLTRFENPVICKEFYEILQNKIIESLNEISDRLLANIVRGYGKWGFGTNEFYLKLEEKCMERCEFMEELDYSTVLYVFACIMKGSEMFYKKFEMVFLEKYCSDDKKILNNHDLLFIFYAFAHIREIYVCSEQTQNFFKNIIFERLSEFSNEELAPLTALYSTYFKDNKRFFPELKKILLEKKIVLEKIKNLAELMKAFSINAPHLYDFELTEAFIYNLKYILTQKEEKIQKKINYEVNFLIDITKILFSLSKNLDNQNENADIRDIFYESAAFLEKVYEQNQELVSFVFEKDVNRYYLNQAFNKMNIKLSFLKDLKN